jgi:diguanylate cyclase (GGDEF)-like protein
MIAPPHLADEARRLTSLHRLKILDTAPEERFDRITRLAKTLFGMPAAAVTLIDRDRQWFKSSVGMSIVETARGVSFCGHTIASEDMLVVPDATLDARFEDNPLVTGEPRVRFYAGSPLWLPDGSKVGALCLLDWRPRAFSSEDRTLLKDLARMTELELGAFQAAQIDDLTGVPNRRDFQAQAQHTLNQCCGLRQPASMLFFELDSFKEINGRLGHAEGDRALVAFSAALREAFGEADVVGRIGGDDFAVLLSNCSQNTVSIALGRLRAAVDHCVQAGAIGYDLEYTTGEITPDTSRPCAVEALPAQADALAYERKHGRSNASVSMEAGRSC